MARKKLNETCAIKTLPKALAVKAAALACEVCPANRPAVEAFTEATGVVLELARLAYLTGKFWGPDGVKLSVAFLDGAGSVVRGKILAALNLWNTKGKANAKFVETATINNADIRIARVPEDGHYSYLGTDCRLVAKGRPTMNLAGFSNATPDSEFLRVPPHEGGHALGFPHEHLRAQLVGRIDRAKAIAYFMRTQGWSEETVVANVLTPLEETSIRGTPEADEESVMCYWLSGEITLDGLPIKGGSEPSMLDYETAAKTYPMPLPPVVEELTVTVTRPGTYKLVFAKGLGGGAV